MGTSHSLRSFPPLQHRMPYESADARTALMNVYFSRYPPAGKSNSRTSSRTHGKERNAPSHQDGGTRSLRREAFMKDLHVHQPKDGSVAGVPIRQTISNFASGRTIYDVKESEMPGTRWLQRQNCSHQPPTRPTLAELRRVEAEQRWKERDHGKELERHTGRREEHVWNDLTSTPPRSTYAELMPMPGLSPSGSTETTDSEMTWPDDLPYAEGPRIEAPEVAEMFEMFVNFDECSESEYMW